MSIPSTGDSVLKKVLPNGLTVLLKEDHSSPVVAINIWIKVGSVNETGEQTGLAHFQEHMVFKGTEKYGVGEIANLVKSVGGNLNAGTSYSYTMYYIVLPSRDYSLGLAVQADAMMRSAFDAEEFRKERIVVIDEARMYDDQPDAYTFYRTMELGYKVHNYRRPIAGYEKVVEKIKREQLLDFYRTYYRPSNAILVVVGDVNPDAALEEIEEVYAEWEDRSAEILEPSEEPKQEAFRLRKFYGSIDHGYVGFGFHIPSILHQDYPALEMMDAILGSGKSSRLYLNVLEDKRLVTTIKTRVLAEKWPGFFQIYASMPAGKLKASLNAIFDEVERFKKDAVSEAELLKARRQLEKYIYSKLETMEGQASDLGYYELLGDYRLAKKHQEAIKKVTADEVSAVAGKYFNLKNCSVVAYLPEELDIPGLEPDEVEKELGKRLEIVPAATVHMKPEREIKTSGPVDESRTISKYTGEEGTAQVKLHRLENGLRVLIKRRPMVPLVSMLTMVRGGASLEPKVKSGISLLTHRTLLKGAGSYSAEDIAKTVEGFGGSVESFSGFDLGGIYINVLSEHLESVLPVYKEIVRRPAFAGHMVEKEKEKLLEELAKRRDHPVHYSIDNLFANVFGDHPYSSPFLGQVSQVKKLNEADCKRWYKRVFVPGNMVICFVGDISEDTALDLAGRLYGDLEKGRIPTPEESAPETAVYPGKHELARTKIKQSVVLAGFTAPPMMTKDAICLEVLNGILAGLGGRLFVELRDKRSLGYMTGSSFIPLKERSIFFGFANPTADGANEALEVIVHELEKVAKEAVSDEELRRSREWLIGTQVMELQRNLSQAMVHSKYEVLGFGYDTVDRMPEIIQGVTKEEVRKAAARVFETDPVFIKLLPKEESSEG